MQVFNRKTHEQILGARAMQSAGLKSITGKHLVRPCSCLFVCSSTQTRMLTLSSTGKALAAASVGLVAEQTPVVRAALARLLPGKMQAVLGEFVPMRDDLARHQKEIFAKVRVMGGAAAAAAPAGAGFLASGCCLLTLCCGGARSSWQ